MSSTADEVVAIGAAARTPSVRALAAEAVRRRVLIVVLRVVVGVAFVWLWQHASGRWIDTLLISSPEAVGLRLWRWTIDGTLWTNLSVTLEATALGFVIGCSIGFSLGLLFGRIPPDRGGVRSLHHGDLLDPENRFGAAFHHLVWYRHRKQGGGVGGDRLLRHLPQYIYRRARGRSAVCPHHEDHGRWRGIGVAPCRRAVGRILGDHRPEGQRAVPRWLGR